MLLSMIFVSPLSMLFFKDNNPRLTGRINKRKMVNTSAGHFGNVVVAVDECVLNPNLGLGVSALHDDSIFKSIFAEITCTK